MFAAVHGGGCYCGFVLSQWRFLGSGGRDLSVLGQTGDELALVSCYLAARNCGWALFCLILLNGRSGCTS